MFLEIPCLKHNQFHSKHAITKSTQTQPNLQAARVCSRDEAVSEKLASAKVIQLVRSLSCETKSVLPYFCTAFRCVRFY